MTLLTFPFFILQQPTYNGIIIKAYTLFKKLGCEHYQCHNQLVSLAPYFNQFYSEFFLLSVIVCTFHLKSIYHTLCMSEYGICPIPTKWGMAK